ncbi:MAG TPA: ankyrin repeat domain-containing protein, partial [Bryobacteraceae bacterium]|nr:ankyrin repeat domain-containing protein [Bryobacteraceae bacterium]
MTRQLPTRPNWEQLTKQAKTFLKQLKSGDAGAIHRFEAFKNTGEFTLVAAQHVLAHEYGFENWAALRKQVLATGDTEATGDLVQEWIRAAGRGDLDRVKEILHRHPEIIDERGGDGTRTALHIAAIGNRIELAKLLLDRGANPNIRCDGDSAFPLHFAAEKKSLEMVRLLIDHGADPIGEGDYHELGVIGWATVFADSREVFEYLMAHGARHNIFSAVATGDAAAIRRLVAEYPGHLERRMDLTNQRRRPLHLAVVKKQPESLATLIELGANLEWIDEAELTALDQAALSGEREMTEALLHAGAKLRLPAAIALNRTADIDRLLRREPDCLTPGKHWGTLIVRAAEISTGEVVERLLLAGASVNVRDKTKTAIDNTNGYTPLHGA